MPREMRYRTVGILFYLVVVLSLAATEQGQSFVKELFASSTGSDNAQLWVAAFAVGAGVFTSDAVGFALSALFFFVWQDLAGKFTPGKGAYSALWEKKLSYNPKDFIVTEYRKRPSGGPDEASIHTKFEEQWESYSSDVFLSYVWQYAPKYLDDWDTRRFTLYFAYMSSIVGVALGLIVSCLLIQACDLNFPSYLRIITLAAVAFIIIIVFFLNAQYVKREAWQIVDLWVAAVRNRQLRDIRNCIRKHSGIDKSGSSDEDRE